MTFEGLEKIGPDEDLIKSFEAQSELHKDRDEEANAAQIDRRSRFLRFSPWMTPAAVARVGLEAVARNRAIAVAGIGNRALSAMVRVLPSRVVQGVTSWLMA